MEVTGFCLGRWFDEQAQRRAVYTFDNAKATSKRRTQYFEMFSNRAIYNDGWVACTPPPLAQWKVGKTIDVDDYKWARKIVAPAVAVLSLTSAVECTLALRLIKIEQPPPDAARRPPFKGFR
jgi:hypothetical protein